jgi:hypothetical protein
MYIQVTLLPVKSEGQTLTTMTRQARVHIPRLFRGKNEFCSFLLGVALVTAPDMALLAVQLIIGDFGDFHEAAFFLIPTSHALTGVVEALGKKRSQTWLIGIGG